MTHLNNGSKEKKLNKDQKILAKNSIYSILISYGSYFSSMITSFLMARLISQEEWGFLIIATSYITIASLILSFLPPGLGYSLNYYIPKYIALNQKKRLKYFIKICFFIRIIFTILVYLVSILIFSIFIDIFAINLQNYGHLLILISPIIILSSINSILLEINYSFNRFNFVLLLVLIQNVFNIGVLIICFLFINNVPIELIAIVNVLTLLTPFIFNCVFTFLFLHYNLKNTEEEKLSLKETIKNLSVYGSQMSFTDFISKFYTQLRTQSIGILESPQIVTGYTIADHYREVSTGAIGSLRKPLTISFSSLYANKKYDQIQSTYRILLKFSIFIELTIMAFMFFFADFYLEFIYGESYLVFSLIFRLFMISLIFRVPGTFFFSTLKASDKVKYIVPIVFIISSIRISGFIIGLIYYGIIGALIISLLLNILIIIVLIILTFKILEIKVLIIKLILQYSIFFIALVISLICEFYFLDSLNTFILQSFNLSFFESFNFLSFGIFLLIYLILNIVFKIFNKSDIENIESLFNKDNFTHKSIRKGLKLLKKVII